jgi:ADP-L-glycero-D-manno-heptose 6-epimerase
MPIDAAIARSSNAVEPFLILVTGGAGFIGSNLVAALSERGVAVAVCDRLRRQDKWRNLAKTEIRELIAPEALAGWLGTHAESVETIVHLGAISSTTETDIDLVVEVNFRLSWFLWQWAASHGKRFIYASSAATYGTGEQGFADDVRPAELARLKPLNAYGWSKHLFDRRVARAIAEGEGSPPQWAGLKFFNVYGPNEYHKGAMQSVVALKYPSAAAGHAVTLFKSYQREYVDGGQKRDFIFVRDCAEVIIWLLEHRSVTGIFNVGSGEARSFNDLAQILFRVVGRPSQIEYIDMPEAIRRNYQYFTQASLERLRAAGFTRAFTSLEDGVQQYVERHLARPDRYS